MNDPCLFEVYLIHRYSFENVEEIVISGNYFPNFYHIAQTFPRLKKLVMTGVNFATMKSYAHNNYSPWNGCAHLREVTIEKCRASFPFSDGFWEFLLTSGSRVSSLSLTGMQLAGKKRHMQSCRIFSALSRFPQLSVLQLCDANLSFDDFILPQNAANATLASLLKSSNTLTHVDLSGNSIGIAASTLFHCFAQSHSAVTSLTLARCGIKPETITNCCDKLKFLPTLRHLDVSENLLGSCAAGLVESLRHCPNLNSLHMNKCGLDVIDVHTIAPYLARLKSLSQLNLSNNNIEHEFLSFVHQLPTSVTSLTLRHCGIDLRQLSAHSLQEAFKSHQVLRHLDLQENTVGSSLKPLLCALEKSQVELLNLRQCRLLPSDFREASHLLPKLRHLQELVIGINGVCHATEDVRERLAKHLRHCRVLKKLVCCRMLGENFTKDQLKRLRDKHGVHVVMFG